MFSSSLPFVEIIFNIFLFESFVFNNGSFPKASKAKVFGSTFVEYFERNDSLKSFKDTGKCSQFNIEWKLKKKKIKINKMSYQKNYINIPFPLALSCMSFSSAMCLKLGFISPSMVHGWPSWNCDDLIKIV